MSQPALSRSIQSLEKTLGSELFDRSSPNLEPTPIGQMLIRHGRRMLAAMAELQSELNELRGQDSSRLSIACGHYPAELTIPGALSELMQVRPQANVNMEVADWSRIAALLQKGICDLAITELVAADHSSGLACELLNDRELYLVVRKAHPLLGLDKPGLEEVLAFPWIGSRIPSRVARAFGPGPFAAGEMDPDSGNFIPRVIAASLSTAFKLVIENDIVGIAPITLAWPYVRRGELCLVPFRAPWLHLNYGFMWQAQRPLTTVTRAFMKLVRAAESRVAAEEQAIRASLRV